MRKVLIWAETSSEIGMGHVKRCLVLADRLKAEGFSIHFVTTERTESYEVHNGYGVLEAANFSEFCYDHAWLYKYVIIDTYKLTTQHLKDARKCFKHIIVIDDLNNLDYYNVDLVINGDYQANNWKYSCAGKTLLGSRYLLIGPEFSKRVYKKEHVLVLTGGTNDALVEKIQEIFASCKPWNNFDTILTPNLSKYKNDTPLPELMQKAFVVVTSCGMSVYEALSCGASVIGYIAAENQRPVAEALAKDGIITLANSLEELPNLVENHPVFNLATYSLPRFYPIDNLGTQRIVEEIKALS